MAVGDMTSQLRETMDFLCQTNNLNAALEVHCQLASIGFKLKPSDKEYMRLLFATLRYKFLHFDDDLDATLDECDEIHAYYDSAVAGYNLKESDVIEARLHMSIQFVLIPIRLRLDRYKNGRLEWRCRFVPNIDYRQLLSRYLSRGKVPDDIQRQAVAFYKKITGVLADQDHLSMDDFHDFHHKLQEIVAEHPQPVFVRNAIRFMNHVEDLLFGGGVLDITLLQTTACIVPQCFLTQNWDTLQRGISGYGASTATTTPVKRQVNSKKNCY